MRLIGRNVLEPKLEHPACRMNKSDEKFSSSVLSQMDCLSVPELPSFHGSIYEVRRRPCRCDILSSVCGTGSLIALFADRDAVKLFDLVTRIAVSLSIPSASKACSGSSASINRRMDARYSTRFVMEEASVEKHCDVTIASFERWLRTSKPGDRFVYYHGNLAGDREEVIASPSQGNYVHVYYEPMHGLGQIAWFAYEHGVVTLAQKKTSDGKFDYIAFKRDTRKRR